MTEMKTLSSSGKDEQLQRLISKKYVNPYDVLELGPEASEMEIKKKYRMLSIMVHPDKNPHE